LTTSSIISDHLWHLKQGTKSFGTRQHRCKRYLGDGKFTVTMSHAICYSNGTDKNIQIQEITNTTIAAVYSFLFNWINRRLNQVHEDCFSRFLQAKSISFHPVNSVKALRENSITQHNNKLTIFIFTKLVSLIRFLINGN